MKRLSIEQWAKKFLSIHHPGETLDFDKQVTKIQHFPFFTLKVFDSQENVKDYYFVMPSENKFHENSKPYSLKLLPYLLDALENEVCNIWIGYVIIGIDKEIPCAIDAQSFKIERSILLDDSFST